MRPIPMRHLTLVFLLALVGCSGPPPTMDGRAGLLSKTNVAQKCEAAAKQHDRPFVVEWDATDLASFEATAGSRTVFVKYEGCKLDVLHTCKDSINPQKFGAYPQVPQFTSGTMQGFDIKNEGDLFAKLPLGVANLGGRVSAGETLHLKYFVSGVQTSSRDAIYRGEIEKTPGCAGATHWVWAYNLGAFELATNERSGGSADVSVQKIGVGGGRSHEETQLGNGGSLADCETQSQRRCRVPIRLALKPVENGDNPLGATNAALPAGGAPGAGPAPDWRSSPAMQAQEAFIEGSKKLEARDGVACLQLLERSLKLDPRQADNPAFRYTRAACLMRAGQCDEGMKAYRENEASKDTSHVRSDKDLDRATHDAANQNCPSAVAKTAPDFAVRAHNEMVAALVGNDGKTCREKFEQLVSKEKEVEKDPAFGSLTQGLEAGSRCIANSSKSCAEGLKYWQRYYCIQLHHWKGCEKTAADSWSTMVKFSKEHPESPASLRCN